LPAPSAEPTKPAAPPAPEKIDSPAPDLAARGPSGPKKSHPARKKRAPALDEPSKMTGLDKNGIGIPSN
jgi:hypothetical protein